ncbi:hypothetical protein B0I35DRAFT_204244 [Stachybotrys elegans]|uniref:Uncharacterized protein n=1 Tax=Stachybotrys elegans TaxID=80388 RepID=A0A8K0WS15_9HYPO|nr:hypothetical protein B0I35DRAFT_204244 [Stachybotrys elegans]
MSPLWAIITSFISYALLSAGLVNFVGGGQFGGTEGERRDGASPSEAGRQTERQTHNSFGRFQQSPPALVGTSRRTLPGKKKKSAGSSWGVLWGGQMMTLHVQEPCWTMRGLRVS